MKPIYVDNNATTQVAGEVMEAMKPFLTELYGNPSSMHSFGGDVGNSVKAARTEVANLLNASPEEIVFTSCGTESDNMAVKGIMEASRDKKATQELGRRLERLVSTRLAGDLSDRNMVRWLEGLPTKTRQQLGRMGLLDPRAVASSKPIRLSPSRM